MKIKKTDEELVALIQSGTDVQENMTLLYKQYKGYMYWLAAKFPMPNKADKDDLVQEGYFGLLEAVNRFEEGKGLFITYARFRIEAHMYTHFQKMRYSVTTTAHIWREANKQRKGIEISESNAELLQHLESESLYKLLPGTDYSIEGICADETDVENAVIEDICRNQQKKTLWDCVNSLSEKQAFVIIEKYKNNKSLTEMAAIRGITEGGIGQLESKALSLLWEKAEIQAMRDNYDYQSDALKYVGFTYFKDNRESSVERVVSRKMELEEKWNARLEKIERELNQLTEKQKNLLESLFNHTIDEIIPCILELPKQMLEIFIMRTVEGSRNKDVAGVLNISKNNVYISNRKAISKITEALKAVS